MSWGTKPKYISGGKHGSALANKKNQTLKKKKSIVSNKSDMNIFWLL